jgi:ABC-type multidrug transport system fused ATPase/permease subunit
VAIAWGIKTIAYMTAVMDSVNQLSTSLITAEKCFDWVDHANIENDIGMKKPLRSDAYSALEFKNVSTMNDNQNSFALKNLSLDIGVNKRVGLMGPASEGKCEIMKASLGLKEIVKRRNYRDNGTVRVFGQSVTELNPFLLRQRTMALFRDGKLFAGTVRENIDFMGDFSDGLMVKTLYWLKVQEVLDVEHYTEYVERLIESRTDSRVNSKPADGQ